MSKIYTIKLPERKADAPEQDKVRVTPSEMDGLKHLVALEEMAAHIGALEQRLKGIPRGMLRLGQIRAATKSLKRDVYATIPDKQRQNIEINFAGMGYTFGVRRPDGIGMDKTQYGLWVNDKFLQVCEDAIREHCTMCSLDVQHQRSCPYAEVRDEMPGPKDRNARGCGYFGL